MQSGQTLNDRLNAARYALAGQGLARAVCKATTEEMIAPKKKHIDYLLQCTNEPNVSIPQLANLLIERTAQASWVVVFKSLVTVHHLMCYGNERFTQYLASSNSSFQLNNYTDKTGPKGYDMSVFIRRYAKYLNTKALSYRTVAFDFTKIKRGGDGQLRAMSVEKLLKTIPVLQEQVDHLLEFECASSDLTNQVINAAFFLLFKDLIRLFACYNDGIINCLEKFFEMNNKKQCREALDIYKRFLARMNKVGVFLKVAENVGIDKGEIPDLTKAPGSLLDAMEQHLAALEGRKPPPPSANGADDEASARKAIEEEEKFLNKLKTENKESEKHSTEKKPDHNPFLDMGGPSTSEAKSNDIMDLFTLAEPTVSQSKPANDLFSIPSPATSAAPAPAAAAAAASNPFADILSSLNTNIPQPASAAGGDGFATSDGFAAAFGSSSNSNIEATSPTQESKKGPPSRPPAPSPSTPSGPGPARPPLPTSRSGSATPTGDETKGPRPARPPAPSGLTPSGSGASTPSIPAMPAGFGQMGGAAQMQQFMAMQQQMMSMMALQAGAKDEASAAMMADQMSKMQAMLASMTACMNISSPAAPEAVQPTVTVTESAEIVPEKEDSSSEPVAEAEEKQPEVEDESVQ